MNNIPYYFTDNHKKYEIEYLQYNNYIFIKDLSYTTNDSKAIILLFNFEGENVLRGYGDGIIFPKINYFNVEKIHVKNKDKKLQDIFDYIVEIFDNYNIVNTKIYQDPYLCFKLGYSIFSLIDICKFKLESNIHTYINYSKEVILDNLESEMDGGVRRLIHNFKKNLPTIDIYFGEIEDNIFESFINKHLELSGKKTKSNESWNFMKKMIQNREAILLAHEENYVLFHTSKKYSYYGVNACTKKSTIVSYLFYEGIKWLIKNECEFIHFGMYHKYYEDEKKYNIAKFKKSFCNKMYTQYYLVK